MTIVITGASGTLGRALTPLLAGEKGGVRALSRKDRPAEPGVEWRRADLLTGEGLAAALDGASAVVHCATDPRRPKSDVPATRNLVEAARAQGDPHLIYVSIVGVEGHHYPYYRVKVACERLVAESGLPFTILRATQFHDLLAMVFGYLVKVPLVMPVLAGIEDQPVDVSEVAARLVEIVGDGPQGLAPDLGGPEVLGFADLARTYLEATGRKRLLVPVPLPGRIGRDFRRGLHLAPDHAAGGRTWREYLT
ncbi:SDR family oxidoreductase [Spirillospora sp. CA-294931]|uniref:SDR family oxidoreductase n=1 Tax=Spirillospora sp. CA-294931 TaxID=3240042 RepID=UPI003D8BCE42